MQQLTQPRAVDPERLQRLLVVSGWALLIAVVAIVHYRSAAPPTLMGTRAAGVASSIDVLDHGGPPLVASDVPYHVGIDPSHLSRAGATDDQGIYLYLPVLGHWTGEHDPAVLMKWLFAGCFAILIFLVPFIVYGLFGSLLAAAAAPLLILWKFDLTNSDLYWVQAWCILLGVPALVLAYRWWSEGRRRSVLALLAPLMLTAGFASSIRSHSGLPILLSALGVVLLAGGALRTRGRREWLVRAGLAAALLVSYFSVTFGFIGLRAYRDSRVDLAPAAVPASHPFWHPTYLGLGYLPNKYGIAWDDAVAIDAVGRAQPNAPYLSPAYEHALRHLYVNVVTHDPVFALHTYFAKARVVVVDALHEFWLAPLLLAAALALRRTRGARVALLLSLPALAIGAASPLLAIPTRAYELGWLGAVGAAWLLAISWVLSHAVAIVRSPLWRQASSGQLPWPPARAAAAAALVLVAAGAFAVTGRPAIQSSDGAYATATPFADVAVLKRPTQVDWHFGGRLARDWHVVQGVELQKDNGGTTVPGTHVTTTTTPNADQLRGPALFLRPGQYAIVGSVNVLVGGLGLVVRDEGSGTTLGEGDYRYGEGDYLNNAVEATFTINRRTRVRPVVVNWSSISNASSWVLWDLRLQRLGGTAKAQSDEFHRTGASPLTASSALAGSSLDDWSFAGSLPSGWATSGNPQVAPSNGALGVRTTAEPATYQLVSDPIRLPPGRYAASIDGRVIEGGIELGILDDTKGAWITTQHFYDAQGVGGGHVMAATVTLTAPTRVRVILSNWAQGNTSSTWRLTGVRLVRLR